MTTLLAIGLFGLFFFMMGVGFFIRGMVLKGSCGAAAVVMGEPSCGACAKKEAEICPTDDKTGLIKLGLISNPHRPLKEHDREPGYDV